MFVHDMYVLGESDPFEIKMREEATVNLELKKVTPCYHTSLVGNVCYRNLPIRNATVMVLDENCSPLSSTTTDENGRYRFCSIIKPGKYKVIATAIGYNTSNMKTICISKNIVTRLSFTLKKSWIVANGIVYGKILEAGSKKAIEGANVYLKASKDDCEMIYKTISNHGGQYLIYDIWPNNYKIIIEKKDYMVTEPIELKIEKYNRICLYFDLIKDSML
ncbi:MAG: carboxypeptidase regulatory-like domain-containing protein [Velocimicrobium sp.]